MDIIHDIQHNLFQDRPQTPGAGLRLMASLAIAPSAPRKSQLDIFKLKQLFVLFNQGIFRLCQISDQCLFAKFLRVAIIGSLPINSGISPNLKDLPAEYGKNFSDLLFFLLLISAPKPMDFFLSVAR